MIDRPLPFSLKLNLVLGLAVVAAFAVVSGADPAPVVNFTLTDPRDQKAVALDDFKAQKAVVLVFLGTECPINNAYLPRLAELAKEYQPRGVQFLAINANRQDSADEVAAHARKFEVPFPVLKDPGNVVADRLGAQRTPEAFVLDDKRLIRYQGRIDDQFGIGVQRPQPTHRDLAEALDAVLAGREVRQPKTDVAGCLISRVAPPKADGSRTFTRDVAPILQKHCQDCHRPGQIGPMALLSYEDASAWAATIREVVTDSRMPPWYADPRHGKFANDRRLSAEDKAALLSWIDQGCPQGDPRDLPPPRHFPAGWRIGTPDLVLTMPNAFDVPAAMPRRGIPYQHFEIDPHFTEDHWVERAETRPDAAGVVHHMLVFVVPPGRTFQKDDPSIPVLCGTAPGDMPMMLEPGLAKKVPAGGRLVLQMHYTPNGTAQKDRSSIGLIFARQLPKGEVHTYPVFNAFFRIPPGDPNYLVESVFTFEKPGRVIAFMPHMHLRGKDFLYRAVYPDGKNEVLLSVPRYNFNWQTGYVPAEPIRMPQGSRVRCVAHFDNSAGNPNNPDPTRAVFWGDQTWEEMMIGWMDYVYDE